MFSSLVFICFFLRKVVVGMVQLHTKQRGIRSLFILWYDFLELAFTFPNLCVLGNHHELSCILLLFGYVDLNLAIQFPFAEIPMMIGFGLSFLAYMLFGKSPELAFDFDSIFVLISLRLFVD